MAQVVRRPTASGEFRYDVRTRIAGRVVTKTFRRRKDAEAYANSVEAEKLRGMAVDPRLARVELAKWASSWMAQRVDLRPKTRQLYGYLLNSFVLPRLGTTPLAQLTPSVVRAWHAQLATERPRIAPKAYQVLRSCLSTAVTDGLLAVNPCRVKGAGRTHSPERPVASMAEAGALAANIDEHLRVMVLLAYWCSLRIGELRGLRRRDIDLLHGWIEVREQVVEVAGTLSTGPTKTAAGRRRIAIPPHVRADVERHLSEWVDSSVDAYVFTGARGAAPLPAASWQRAWNAA